MDTPAFDEKFNIPPEPYPSVPGVEDCKRSARQSAMEEYGRREDVYNMLFRYLNDLLTTQPKDSLDFMLKWATKEVKNPKKVEPPVEVDRTFEMYNLRVELEKKAEQGVKGRPSMGKR